MGPGLWLLGSGLKALWLMASTLMACGLWFATSASGISSVSGQETTSCFALPLKTPSRRRRLEKCNRESADQNMNKAEIIARLLMVLLGFALAMLGLIYAIHTQDVYLGILIAVGGVASMLGEVFL